MMRLCALLCCLSLCYGADWVGYGGPLGKRVYNEVNPPAGALTVKWQAPISTWGHGQPIYVETNSGQGRLYLLREVGPDNVFPVLVCLDASTGKTLWERELDYLSAVSGINADAIRNDLKAYWDREAELIKAYIPNKKDKTKQIGRDKEQKTRGEQLKQQIGFHRDGFRRGQYADGFACFGDAFATPCSDGERVYVAYNWGGVMAFDLDGKQQWVTHVPGGEWTWNNLGRSPILHKGVLYYDGGDLMRAIDTKTGKVLWTDQKKGENSMVSPAVITVDGVDILLSASEVAYRLPKGERLTVTGWKDVGMQILVKSDERDVAYFCGKGEHCGWTKKGNTDIKPPAAFRFSLSGSTLQGDVLWHGGNFADNRNFGGNNSPWMVYDDNKFYHRGNAILDPMTGKTVAGKWDKWMGTVPRTGHLLKVAGGRIWGLKGNKGIATLTSRGQGGAESTFTPDSMTAEQQRAHLYVTGKQSWKNKDKKTDRFSYSSTFTFGGDQVFARSHYYIIALGK